MSAIADHLNIRAYEEIVYMDREILAAVSAGVWKEDWPPSLKTATLLALSYAIALVGKKMKVRFLNCGGIGMCTQFFTPLGCGSCPGYNFEEERCEYNDSETARTIRHDLERALMRMTSSNRTMVLTGKAIRTVYAHVID